MEKLICLNCGKVLTKSTKYCSDKCKKKYRYDRVLYDKKCIVCNKAFKANAGTKCCSNECFLKSQRIYKKICPICGSRFKARGNGIYCSNLCYRTANSSSKGLIVAKCEVCNSTFKTRKDKAELTCSKECNSKLFTHYIDNTLLKLFNTTDKNEIQHFLKNNFQK